MALFVVIKITVHYKVALSLNLVCSGQKSEKNYGHVKAKPNSNCHRSINNSTRRVEKINIDGFESLDED